MTQGMKSKKHKSSKAWSNGIARVLACSEVSHDDSGIQTRLPRVALGWLGTVMHLAKDSQVRNREKRRAQITATWASLARHPPRPLRRFNCRASAVHRILHDLLVFRGDILLIVIGIERLIVHVGDPIPIFRPCRFHVERTTRKISVVGTSASIASASAEACYGMPRGRELAIAVILGDVELHADGAAVVLNVAIAILPGIVPLHRDCVNVRVHCSMCLCCVHVELNVATKQVKRCFSADATVACYFPAIVGPVDGAIF